MMQQNNQRLAVSPLDKPSMDVRVNAGEYERQGRKIFVNESIELSIDPPERLTVTGEQHILTNEKPDTWHLGTILEKTKGSVDTETRLPGAIAPESVVLRSIDGSKVYEEGTDYFLDHLWGGLCRLDSGSVAPDQQVAIDYQVLRQRIDAVQIATDGSVSIKKGNSVDISPTVPQADAGCALLATVYVPFRTVAIDDKNVLQAPEEDIDWRDFISVAGRDNLKRTLAALDNGQPLTIVCWGDSVTAGASAVPYENGYVGLLSNRLHVAYPENKINIINAGIGGSSTETRLGSFDTEVLAHNPDLITVEFLNDLGQSREMRKKNWNEFFARARAHNPNVEFIIITPNLKFPEWMEGFYEGVATMKTDALENHAALADATHVWENLWQLGIPYEALLANNINHPNNLAHEFFVETLLSLLGVTSHRVI